MKGRISFNVYPEVLEEFHEITPKRGMSKIVEKLISKFIDDGICRTDFPRSRYRGYAVTFTIDVKIYERFRNIVQRNKNSKTVENLIRQYLEIERGK